MTLKFYMPPGSYATDIPFLLEVLYLPFDVTVLNLPAGDHANACRLPPDAAARLLKEPVMSKPDIFARNRVILTHFDSYSVALLFPRWEKTLLWPTALPDGAAPMRPPRHHQPRVFRPSRQTGPDRWVRWRVSLKTSAKQALCLG